MACEGKLLRVYRRLLPSITLTQLCHQLGDLVPAVQRLQQNWNGAKTSHVTKNKQLHCDIYFLMAILMIRLLQSVPGVKIVSTLHGMDFSFSTSSTPRE